MPTDMDVDRDALSATVRSRSPSPRSSPLLSPPPSPSPAIDLSVGYSGPNTVIATDPSTSTNDSRDSNDSNASDSPGPHDSDDSSTCRKYSGGSPGSVSGTHSGSHPASDRESKRSETQSESESQTETESTPASDSAESEPHRREARRAARRKRKLVSKRDKAMAKELARARAKAQADPKAKAPPIKSTATDAATVTTRSTSSKTSNSTDSKAPAPTSPADTRETGRNTNAAAPATSKESDSATASGAASGGQRRQSGTRYTARRGGGPARRPPGGHGSDAKDNEKVSTAGVSEKDKDTERGAGADTDVRMASRENADTPSHPREAGGNHNAVATPTAEALATATPPSSVSSSTPLGSATSATTLGSATSACSSHAIATLPPNSPLTTQPSEPMTQVPDQNSPSSHVPVDPQMDPRALPEQRAATKASVQGHLGDSADSANAAKATKAVNATNVAIAAKATSATGAVDVAHTAKAPDADRVAAARAKQEEADAARLLASFQPRQSRAYANNAYMAEAVTVVDPARPAMKMERAATVDENRTQPVADMHGQQQGMSAAENRSETARPTMRDSSTFAVPSSTMSHEPERERQRERDREDDNDRDRHRTPVRPQAPIIPSKRSAPSPTRLVPRSSHNDSDDDVEFIRETPATHTVGQREGKGSAEGQKNKLPRIDAHRPSEEAPKSGRPQAERQVEDMSHSDVEMSEVSDDEIREITPNAAGPAVRRRGTRGEKATECGACGCTGHFTGAGSRCLDPKVLHKLHRLLLGDQKGQIVQPLQHIQKVNRNLESWYDVARHVGATPGDEERVRGAAARMMQWPPLRER